MMIGGGYIANSITAIGSINPDQLGRFELGPSVGMQGNEYAMRTLGPVGLSGFDIDVGLKFPHDPKRHVRGTLQQALEAAELLACYVPELTPQLPKFMGLLCVGDSKPLGILTEDASRGGTLPVEQLTYNRRLADSVAASLRAAGDGISFNRDATLNVLSFNAGGEQRLLDFTPPPLERVDDFDLTCVLHGLIRNQNAFTVTVDPGSTLGQSLMPRISSMA